MADLRAEIEQRNQEFMDAFNRGDAAGVAAAYTDDARVLPPGGNPVSGRRHRAVLEGRHGDGHPGGRLADGDGRVRRRPRLRDRLRNPHREPEGGNPTTQTAKYVVIWKRQAGRRWLAVDIWNSNS